MIWYVLSAVAVLVFVDLLTRIYFGRIVLRHFETKPAFNIAPSPADPRGELIEIPASGGLTLRGSLYRQAFRTPVGLIVFFPELDGNHWSALNYCEALFEAGFDVLSVDVRNQGDSDYEPGYEPLQWFTSREAEDVRSVFRWIENESELKALPLGVMGVSRGSNAAMLAAAEHPSVKAVCCEGGYPTAGLQLRYSQRWAVLYIPLWLVRILPEWHYRYTLALVRLISEWRRGHRYVMIERMLPRLRNRPVLLIGGERDNYVPPDVVEHLAQRIGGTATRCWIVPRSRHNGGRVAAREVYDQTLLRFFQTSFGHEPSRDIATARTA
ncbi:alpha/beta hydrolase [Planctellipticum variicoloris]|uniref:alpha/beta hydrolase n=1 Tax=Planctellipticum variicoloris TaxID=3064265 RepID=UPI003013C9B3|nr:lysophospholipase [Planctomycetaceae bacterium SH412]